MTALSKDQVIHQEHSRLIDNVVYYDEIFMQTRNLARVTNPTHSEIWLYLFLGRLSPPSTWAFTKSLGKKMVIRWGKETFEFLVWRGVIRYDRSLYTYNQGILVKLKKAGML